MILSNVPLYALYVDSEVIRKYVKEQQEDQIRNDQLRLWKDSSE
jgi:hypothetical protein